MVGYLNLAFIRKRARSEAEGKDRTLTVISAYGPTPTTWAVQQVVGYLGYPGRGADVTGTLAPDPIRPWASFNHLMAIAASVTPAARCPAIRDVSLNRNRQLTVAFSL